MTPVAGAVGVPAWFRHAIAASPVHREHSVGGCQIHYRAWGLPDRPGLVLIHGGGAHSGWWDHIGPLLDTHRVVAIDLSGHGDSGRRPAYDLTLWSDEVMAVAAAEGLVKPVLVGHSMGGWVAVSTAARHGALVGSAIIIDSPLVDQPPEEEELSRRRRPTRVYLSREDAIARFTTTPEQELLLPYIARHIAEESVRPVEGGWTWKFDPTLFGRRPPMRELLPQVRVPISIIRCEQGLVTEEMARDMERLAGGGLVVALPATGHHPMFDQPVALVAALRSLLALSRDARAA
jgi:pimeloyl-ACP methyl ester carboxylesterase